MGRLSRARAPESFFVLPLSADRHPITLEPGRAVNVATGKASVLLFAHPFCSAPDRVDAAEVCEKEAVQTCRNYLTPAGDSAIFELHAEKTG